MNNSKIANAIYFYPVVFITFYTLAGRSKHVTSSKRTSFLMQLRGNKATSEEAPAGASMVVDAASSLLLKGMEPNVRSTH